MQNQAAECLQVAEMTDPRRMHRKAQRQPAQPQECQCQHPAPGVDVIYPGIACAYALGQRCPRAGAADTRSALSQISGDQLPAFIENKPDLCQQN